LHQRQEKLHQQNKRAPNKMHRYLRVKRQPQVMAELRTPHKKALMRLYDEVVKEISATSGYEELHPPKKTTNDFFRCLACNVSTVRHRFYSQCPKCHTTQATISSCDRNFKEFDSCDTSSHVTYKRTNHFNEWLLRTQGKELRIVPVEVLDAVRERLQLCHTPVTKDSHPKLAYNVVRSALAMSRYQDYFEHVPQIMRRVTAVHPPDLSDEVVAQIRVIFCQLQEPFFRLKPPTRRNFLSYSYVIYKVCELMELDEVLPFCPLFKSIQNQRSADVIWKLICNDLGYEFIPTV
jgi:hypothetical protein